MTLKQFIRENRTGLDAIIRQVSGDRKLNDSEREDWILNDEGLYLWAKSEGVRI